MMLAFAWSLSFCPWNRAGPLLEAIPAPFSPDTILCSISASVADPLGAGMKSVIAPLDTARPGEGAGAAGFESSTKTAILWYLLAGKSFLLTILFVSLAAHPATSAAT